MQTPFIRWSLALATLAFCGVAEAHPGHGIGYMAGLAHPFLGLDHLLAMFAIGVWASQLGGRATWLVPASFVTVMAVAAGFGAAGIALPMVESGIAASVLVLGLLVAFAVRLPFVLGCAMVGLFAVFHGYAHGAEMPQSATWQYSLGFVMATAALHGAGLLAGRSLNKQAVWIRAVGTVVAASGAWMLATI
jgi:urease accessory protein